MASALLIFPHQLFSSNAELARGKRVYLIEEPLLFDQFAFHKHKLVLHRATTKMHETHLREAGHPVTYIDRNAASSTLEMMGRVARDGVHEVHVLDLTDDWLEQRVAQGARVHGIAVVVHETPMFLSTLALLQKALGDKPHFSMAQFYIQQRKRLNILVADGKPVGDRWSLDAENRKRLPHGMTPPALNVPASNQYLDEARLCVEQRYADHPGDAGTFRYPVTYADATAGCKIFSSIGLHCSATTKTPLLRNKMCSSTRC